MVASNFEWLQGLQHERWTDELVRTRMRTGVQDALERVLRAADELDTDLRTAAMTVAVERVARTAEARGVYP